jgi:hypothetical protein
MNDESKKKIGEAMKLAWKRRKAEKRSKAMRLSWKRRKNGSRSQIVGKIQQKTQYTIKTVIVGNSKKELLAKVRFLAQQIRRDVK